MELINIFFQISLFFIFFSLGIFIKQSNLGNSKIKINSSENLIFNVIIHINFLLLLSFLNIGINEILITYFILLFILFVKNYPFYLKDIRKNYLNLFVLFISCVIISVDLSNSLSLGWDGQKIWIYKAINFYDGGTIESLKYLDKGDGYDYPYLGSLLWAIFWKISFINEEYFGRLFYIFLYTLSIFSIIERLNSSTYSKIIIFIILILLSYDYFYFGGSQDILIFSFMAFISSLCLKILKNKNSKQLFFDFFLLILLCNCLIWTKAEGFIYAVIIIFSLVTCLKIRKKVKLILFLSLIALLLIRISVYKFYDLNIGVNSIGWNDLSISGIYSKITLERIFVIFKYFIYGVLKNYFIIFSLIILIISNDKLKIVKKNLYNYIIIFLSLSFIFSAYLLTDVDLIFMLKVGLDRLLFQISPFFIIIIINYFNNHKLKF